MSEFKFTNEQWREYQQNPDQGYSHRHWIEYQVNEWAARVTPTREQIAAIIDAYAEADDGIQVYEVADAILALMQELAEGGSDAGH